MTDDEVIHRAALLLQERWAHLPEGTPLVVRKVQCGSSEQTDKLESPPR